HAWELSPDEAISAALSNLADRSRGLRVEATSSLVFFCGKRDGFDASRILLPELREKLSSFLGSPFYFGIPHRDLLLVTPQDDNAAHMLLDQIQSAFLRAPHRISPSLFIGHPDRIQATELPGASFEPKLTLRRQA
ncbi:MAG: DUF1444 family protein, partial [Sandaracinaceae bacterium]|nr:DUF1444 family protein [Sandaracinaceae bacterium]